MLHEQLPDMLYAAKTNRLHTSVTTNCLLYPERAAALAGLVDLLHFSLDSLDEKENDSIRGKGSFAKVMESIEIAKKSVDLLLKKKMSFYEIKFFGGEPLLEFDLVKDIISYALSKSNNIKFMLTTNGSLLDEEKIKFFLKKSRFFEQIKIMSFEDFTSNSSKKAHLSTIDVRKCENSKNS